MKRAIDIIVSVICLGFFSPLILLFALLIWVEDRGSPFYIALRVGLDGRKFRMFKLRSMVINASEYGVDSTANNDKRITKLGFIVRKFKLDELMQLVNVLIGDMSLVGPRPNVETETECYTNEEKHLLSIKPGITDFSSIVFSDEGAILAPYKNPDLAYNRLIRPLKSRLGLFYIDKRSVKVDLFLMILTVSSIFSRKMALKGVGMLLSSLGAQQSLIQAARRDAPLKAAPPPGQTFIVGSRVKRHKNG